MHLKYVPSKTRVISIMKVVILKQSQERMMLQTKSTLSDFYSVHSLQNAFTSQKTDAQNWRKT